MFWVAAASRELADAVLSILIEWPPRYSFETRWLRQASLRWEPLDP